MAVIRMQAVEPVVFLARCSRGAAKHARDGARRTHSPAPRASVTGVVSRDVLLHRHELHTKSVASERLHARSLRYAHPTRKHLRRVGASCTEQLILPSQSRPRGPVAVDTRGAEVALRRQKETEAASRP